MASVNAAIIAGIDDALQPPPPPELPEVPGSSGLFGSGLYGVGEGLSGLGLSGSGLSGSGFGNGVGSTPASVVKTLMHALQGLPSPVPLSMTVVPSFQLGTSAEAK